jgi:hypothetical protein
MRTTLAQKHHSTQKVDRQQGFRRGLAAIGTQHRECSLFMKRDTAIQQN